MGREHINGEDAGNSKLRFHATRLAISDACIVDYGVKVTELVDLVGSRYLRCGADLPQVGP
jgi:hypothetical protein